MTAHADAIDHLADIMPGSRLDLIRGRRPQARENAQASYLALFPEAEPEGLSRPERLAVAIFVAELHGHDRARDFYAAELAAAGDASVLEAVMTEAATAGTTGPYGLYPPGRLSKEDRPGLHFRASADGRAELGDRLAAALEHAHLLVFRPRDASPAALQALGDAGLSATEIVTLSQLVAFLTFQFRVAAGLATLASAGDA